MTDRPPLRAAARARTLAELELTLRQARHEAMRLASERPGFAEADLLIAQIERLSSELEEFRLGGFKSARPNGPKRTARPDWRATMRHDSRGDEEAPD